MKHESLGKRLSAWKQHLVEKSLLATEAKLHPGLISGAVRTLRDSDLPVSKGKGFLLQGNKAWSCMARAFSLRCHPQRRKTMPLAKPRPNPLKPWAVQRHPGCCLGLAMII